MKTFVRIALTSVILAASHSALAAEPNTVYVGANVGQSNYNGSAGDCTQALQSAGVSGFCTIDNNDVGFKVYAGYNILPMLAVEGGYVNFGKANIHLYGNSGNGNGAGNLGTGDQQSDGFNVDAVLNVPIQNTPVSVSARLGLYDLHTESHLYLPGGSVSDSSDTTGLHYGVGASFAFTPQLAGRLEVERYQDVGDTDHNAFKSSVDLISVGATYTFK